MSEIHQMPFSETEVKEEPKRKYKKRAPKVPVQSAEPVMDLPDLEQKQSQLSEKDVEAMRAELLSFCMDKPDLLNQPMDAGLSLRINSMDVDELKMRVTLARKMLNSGVDAAVSSGLLMAVNRVVGGFLKCYDELAQNTQQDMCLRDSLGQVMSGGVLGKIPANLKIAALYGSHVLYAAGEARKKRAMHEAAIVVQPQEPPTDINENPIVPEPTVATPVV